MPRPLVKSSNAATDVVVYKHWLMMTAGEGSPKEFEFLSTQGYRGPHQVKPQGRLGLIG